MDQASPVEMSAGPSVTAISALQISSTQRATKEDSRKGVVMITAYGGDANRRAPASLRKIQRLQLRRHVDDRGHIAHARLPRREWQDEITFVDHRIEFSRDGVFGKELSLLIGRVPRRIDQHDHIGIGI